MGSNIKITNELEEYINNHSYKLNPIDKWFEFYFSAKKKGLLPYWTINHGWIL